MALDFSDARVKLSRARKHISDVDAAIAVFLEADLHRLTIEAKQGRREVTLESLPHPKKDINAVIGDAVGNLRSTLDYIAVALVAHSNCPTDEVGFPFAQDDKGFFGTVTKGSLSVVPLVHQHFVTEIQAYQGGRGHTLWVLNKLRNIDKHRFLVATVQITGAAVSFQAGGNLFRGVTFKMPAGEKRSLVYGADVSEAHFANQPNPTFEVRFAEPPLIQGEGVVDFLNGAAGQIEGLLDPLEKLFPSAA
jgi:hypothetical protein